MLNPGLWLISSLLSRPASLAFSDLGSPSMVIVDTGFFPSLANRVDRYHTCVQRLRREVEESLMCARLSNLPLEAKKAFCRFVGARRARPAVEQVFTRLAA